MGEQTVSLDWHRHRQTTLQLFDNSNLVPVRVKQGQKDPAPVWDAVQNPTYKQKHLQELRDTEHNVGVQLYGRTVDVDVDCDNPYIIPALETFLPSCSHVWGRASRPRSHYLYQLKDDFEPTEFPFLKKLKKIDEASVEIRGGQVGRAEYSVMPGSVHPSGEWYAWTDLDRAQGTPAQASVSDLIRGVRLSAAVAVLAPYWQEGIRNDLVMALAGFLYRCFAMLEMLDEDARADAFALNREQSERFLRSFLHIAGDDSDDIDARLKTFYLTWNKAENGARVTGAQRIGEIVGDNAIVGKLYTLLSDNHTFKDIEEFTNRYVVWMGPGHAIDLNWAALGRSKPYMSREQLANSRGDLTVEIGGKRKLLAHMLFGLKTATRVDGLTFEPSAPLLVENHHGTFVNQWSGFEIAPCPEPVSESDVSWFLDYLYNIVASGDERKYQWVLQWIAQIFQQPHKKSRTVLVLVGKPGSGKSFLGEHILRPIIGEAHSAVTDRVEAITKDFNAVFDNKILVQCDEAMNNRQRVVAARMKSLITDDTLKVEPKGVDPYYKPNLMRFILTSNDMDDAVAITEGLDDRRYTVISVSDHKRNSVEEYWAPFIESLDRDALSMIHRYLLQVEVDYTFISRPFTTEARKRMARMSADAMDAWLYEMLSRGHPLSAEAHQFPFDAFDTREQRNGDRVVRENWPACICMSALGRDYEMWRRRAGRRDADDLTISHLVSRLRDRGLTLNPVSRPTVWYHDRQIDRMVQSKIRVREMFSLDQLRSYLSDKLGQIEDDVTPEPEEDDSDVIRDDSEDY